ncbi:MAG TPA: DMT family transporter [Casimicrobiaceae bacterium]|jgi:drug/metabolite transporter (DMT)-like permease|nr:DMT family transporter [Casimicrobiaceae bacterium]
MTSARRAARRVPASGLFLVAILTLVWGCNWPVLKLGVTELAPLTFRGATLPFAAIGLLLAARLSGDSIRIPREHWGKVLALALFNIAAWNGLILFGVQQMPAGRSAILAYTMPVWTVLFGMALLHEPLSRRKIIGLVLGMLGMAVLLGEDVRHITRSPMGTLFILAAAISWAFGTVLLRRWKPPLPQNTLTGWMMLIGWLPIAVCVPLFDEHPISSLAHMSGTAWFAVLYNIFLAGTVAHWAWFTMARTLPVAVSSLSSLPVPVVGVLSGILFLGERPGPSEYIALALVLASLSAVLFAPATKPVVPPE